MLPPEIDVWLLTTDAPDPAIQQTGIPTAIQNARQLLSPAELQTAANHLRPQLQSRYIFRRAALRQILSQSLTLDPREIEFELAEHGKPFLSPKHQTDLQFNLSHSQGQVAIAVTLGARLGIDIEQIRPIPSATKIVAEFFSPAEQQAFASLPSADQNLFFLKLWTRKEAFLKATGKGLTFPLDLFDVSQQHPTLAAPPGRHEGKSDPTKTWSLIDLPTHPNFIGALVIEGEQRTLHQREFTFAKFG